MIVIDETIVAFAHYEEFTICQTKQVRVTKSTWKIELWLIKHIEVAMDVFKCWYFYENTKFQPENKTL